MHRSAPRWNSRTIEPRQSVLDALHARLWGTAHAAAPNGEPTVPTSWEDAHTPEEDHALIERGMAMTNGARFRALWTADFGPLGHDDDSAAGPQDPLPRLRAGATRQGTTTFNRRC